MRLGLGLITVKFALSVNGAAAIFHRVDCLRLTVRGVCSGPIMCLTSSY